MKKALLLALLALTIGTTAHAQRSVDAVEKKFQKAHQGSKDVRPTFNMDLSPVWKNNGYIGFIGADRQRLSVSIGEAYLKENQTYELTGSIMSPYYCCDIKGELLVLHIYPKAPTKGGHLKGEQLYEVFGVYRIEETGERSGRFEGFVQSEVLTQDGKAFLCGMDEADATYRNNQFEGTWIADDNGLQKEANWGLGRIPDSGDLDIGEQMFLPAEKYWKNGWDAYERDARDEARIYMESLYTNKGVIDDHLSWKVWADTNGFAKTTLYCDGEPVRAFRTYHEAVPPSLQAVGNLTYVDANFDQYPDVLISLGPQGVRGVTVYDCYLYDPTTGTYQLADGFDNIIDPTFDAQQKAVYGCGFSSYSTYEHARFEWSGLHIEEKSIVVVTFNEEMKATDYSESQVVVKGFDIDFIPVHEHATLNQLSPEWQEHLSHPEAF